MATEFVHQFGHHSSYHIIVELLSVFSKGLNREKGKISEFRIASIFVTFLLKKNPLLASIPVIESAPIESVAEPEELSCSEGKIGQTF